MDIAEADATFARTVTDLFIELVEPIPLAVLRQCLSMVVNVVDLILLLPSDMPVHLLHGFFLPRLQLFKTNLPHRDLLTFVDCMPGLCVLCVGSCGRDARDRICPLTGADLSRVLTLECPAECLSGTVRKGLIRLTAEDRPSVVGIPPALKSFQSQTLAYLCLEFYPDDYDVLQAIVAVVPRLRKLKLLERHRAMVCSATFPPVNDHS